MKYDRPRFDERDTIFSRMGEHLPGTERYKEYYADHPEKEEGDRILRSAGPGRFADRRLEQTLVDGTFGFLKDIRSLTHGTPGAEKVPLRPEEGAAYLKKMAASYGCVLSGACRMEESFFYSVRGRGEHYGETVDSQVRPYGFIFAVEMDGEPISKAPGPAEMTEVVRGYARVALAGMIISYTLRSMGYDAVCHMDGESEIVLPPAAEKAGLGEIGRMGLLVNKDYGALLRLGAVTTNLPLAQDAPAPFGLKEFCIKCKKCAKFCPSGAIGLKDDWGPVDHESCYAMWRQLDTDCGVCLASCPFSLKGIKKSAPGKGALNIKQFMYENSKEKS